MEASNAARANAPDGAGSSGICGSSGCVIAHPEALQPTGWGYVRSCWLEDLWRIDEERAAEIAEARGYRRSSSPTGPRLLPEVSLRELMSPPGFWCAANGLVWFRTRPGGSASAVAYTQVPEHELPGHWPRWIRHWGAGQPKRRSDCYQQSRLQRVVTAAVLPEVL